jgi:photosystem II stability/assembly factor-like uncharacterized protein
MKKPARLRQAALQGARLALLFFLVSCGSPQQSEPLSPPFTMIVPQHLFTAAYPDSQHIWIAGFDSVIMHSSDGGATWAPQKSPVASSVCDIDFIDEAQGWAVGRGGFIIHTANGGAAWQQQRSGVSRQLFALDAVDERSAWVVGEFGTILHTADGGTTWQDQGSGEDIIYNDVFFLDALRGWVVGEYGTILHTVDGGETWTGQECEDIIPVVSEEEWASFPPSLYGVFFRDELHGLACGMDATIIATDDGGATWHKIDNPAAEGKATLYSVSCSGDACIVVGQKGVVLASSDGGAAWKMTGSQRTTRAWLRDAVMTDALNGIAVGGRGTVLQTMDGARSWRLLSGIPVPRN